MTIHHRPTCNCDLWLLMQMRSENPVDRQRGWEAWYLRDAPVLRGYLGRRCQALHCPTHSEDILQDCFLTGFRNISGGRYTEQGKSLCAYLHGIAKNLLYEVIRLQKKETSDQALADVQVEEKISIENQVYLQEVLKLVEEARSRLSPVHQQVVEGLYGEGKSSNEVATELRKTAGNIRAIARRAVNEIRDYLARQYNLLLPSRSIRVWLEMR